MPFPQQPLRLQYFPLSQHAFQQRLHAQFLRDGDGFVLEFGNPAGIAAGVAFDPHWTNIGMTTWV